MQSAELYSELIRYIKSKFHSRPEISFMAEDIVNTAYENCLKSARFTKEQENFGYLSVACIRVAYKLFMKLDSELRATSHITEIVSEDDFVDDIIKAQDTAEVLSSLQVLRELERIVILERYFGNFTFHEISVRNNIKLNTVLSHHRRALEKLRRTLSKYFDDTNYNDANPKKGEMKNEPSNKFK